jgi:hypothetical protein
MRYNFTFAARQMLLSVAFAARCDSSFEMPVLHGPPPCVRRRGSALQHYGHLLEIMLEVSIRYRCILG